MILLCTASDNYTEKWKSCIDSHELYCKKHNYEYVLITGTRESRNWKRTKIDELQYFLESTTSDVCLIDADCLVKDTCPAINFLNDKSVYYTTGKSGRLNSGFIYFKNDNNSKEFIKELKEKLSLPVPKGKGYFVTLVGENGHIIWLLNEWLERDKDIFKLVSNVWNCSSLTSTDDAYILHFTGLLRKEYHNYLS